MDVDKLRTFVNLAETLSFSKTAENLYIGQSNVSKHIHTLEKEIGNRLFLRNNKVTSLTEAGHLMYPYARKMVNIEDELKNELSKLKRNNNHQLTIGVIPTFSGYNAFKKITEYMKSHFEVTINFQEYETTELWKKLDEDKVDIAFIRVLNNQRLTGYQKIPFKNENFKLWIATNDNLAQRKKVTLRELKDYKFVSLTNSSQLKQPVIKLCQKSGFTPQIIFISNRLSTIEKMVEDQQGVAILMGKPKLSSNIKAIDIQPTLTSNLMFIRKKQNHSKENNKFWNYLLQQDYSSLE